MGFVSDSCVAMPLESGKGWSQALSRAILLLGTLLLARASSGRDALAHFYCVNEPSCTQALETHSRQISLVSPTWFVVDQAGHLQSTLDSAVVTWAQARGVPLMPLLVNDKFQPETAHALLSDPQIQSEVVGRIVEASIAHHFYGIELDLEGLRPADRGAYAQFTRRLAGQLHANHLKLGIAVPAPLASTQPVGSPADSEGKPWPLSNQSEAYDYHALGDAADIVSLMTYEQHIAPGDPGPVAGLPWVDACTRKVLEWIPAKKVLLGVTLYYRDWFGKSVREGGFSEAVSLASKWRAPIKYDRKQGAASVRFQDDQGSHTLWFENAKSLREKVKLVKRYRLLGFSAWRLGFEDPAAWKKCFRKALRVLP
jgi:spore germination protein